MKSKEEDHRKEVYESSATKEEYLAAKEKVDEGKKMCPANSVRRYDVMEKYRVYHQEIAMGINEISLEESNDKAEKIKETSKVVTRTRKKKNEEESPWNFPNFIPPHLFPTAEEALEKKKRFAKMSIIIRKIYVDIALVDVIACVPKYMKFVHKITTNKDTYFNEAVIPVKDKCSTNIQKA